MRFFIRWRVAFREDLTSNRRYRYGCFVTSLTLPNKTIYDLYKGWGDSENRIKEIKNDFSAGKFNSRDFWVTESGESFIIMAYNFISLFRHCIINSKQQHFLKTIRYQILSIPASLEKRGSKNVLRLVRSTKQR